MYHMSPAEAMLLKTLLRQIDLNDSDVAGNVKLLAALCCSDPAKLRESLLHASARARKNKGIHKKVIDIPGLREARVTKRK